MNRLTGVSSELEGGTLTNLSGTDDTDIGWVLDGSDGACSKDQLVPHLAHVEQADTVVLALEHVLFHLMVQVLGTEMGSGDEDLGQVLLLKAKYSLGSRHCLKFLVILSNVPKL